MVRLPVLRRIFDRVGSIRIGKQADLLLVSENLELKRVI